MGIDGNDCGIDKLPDDILINILSRTSLNESARASVLARRWRYLWRSTHDTLRFDHRDTTTRKVMTSEKFESWVNNVVELHQDRSIEGMVINFEVNRSRSIYGAIDSWVCFAMQKEVKRFELNLSSDPYPYQFPSVERLISRSHGVTSPLCHLRTLRLVHVYIEDEVVHYFLASCPNLEELCINFPYWTMNLCTMNLRVIDPPRLRVLEVRSLLQGTLEISAENLVSLTYRGWKNSLMLKKIPNLRELTIRSYFCKSFVSEPKKHWSYSVQLEKLVLDFRSLIIDGQFGASRDLPKLCSLKRLVLQVAIAADQSLLFFTSLVKASPQLREFSIQQGYLLPVSWVLHSDFKYVKFVHKNLKVVEMGGFIGLSSEKQLLLELFEIGRPSIERVVIDTKSDSYGIFKYYPRIVATTRNEAKELAKDLASNLREQVKLIVT